MKTIEIRKKLIAEIKLSDNRHLLEEMYHFINQENEIKNIYNLSNKQKSAIKEAQNQINNGDYLTNEQANQEIEQWLNE